MDTLLSNVDRAGRTPRAVRVPPAWPTVPPPPWSGWHARWKGASVARQSVDAPRRGRAGGGSPTPPPGQGSPHGIVRRVQRHSECPACGRAKDARAERCGPCAWEAQRTEAAEDAASTDDAILAM